MRLPRHPRLPLARRSAAPHGFTLIELLVVVGIIAILVSIGVTGAGYARRNQAYQITRAGHAKIRGALEDFRNEHGEYPPHDKEFSTAGAVGAGATIATGTITVDGTDYTQTGATGCIALYHYLTGDENRNGMIDSGEGGKNYLGVMGISGKEVQLVGNVGGSYIVVDGFGGPFHYLRKTTAGGTVEASCRNPTFDLWSLGQDSAGTNTAQWIINW